MYNKAGSLRHGRKDRNVDNFREVAYEILRPH